MICASMGIWTPLNSEGDLTMRWMYIEYLIDDVISWKRPLGKAPSNGFENLALE